MVRRRLAAAATAVTRRLTVTSDPSVPATSAAISNSRSVRNLSSSSSRDKASKISQTTTPSQPNSFLERVLQPDENGQNALLRIMGYYSPESRAIGAGRTLYDQLLARSRVAVQAEVGETSQFMPQFEMLIIHVYLTLRRLRVEKGNPREREVQTAMQTLFEIFWSDVRTRMMIKEGNLGLIASAKWVKECEKIFYGVAVSFDEAWGKSDKMDDAIRKSMSALRDDAEAVRRFRVYMLREHSRLEKQTLDELWDGVVWDQTYCSVQGG